MATARPSFFRTAVIGRKTQTTICAGCGCVFRTAIDPPVKPAVVEPKGGAKTAETPPAPAVEPADLRPCPSCGLVAPPAVARATQNRHIGVWIAAGVTSAAMGGLAATGLVPFVVAAIVIPGVSAASVLLHLWIAAGNPNRRPRADGLARGKAHVAEGRTDVVLAGQPEVERDPPSWTRQHTAGIVLAAVAPLAMLSPAWVRAVLDRSANPHLHPQVVATEGEFTAPFPPPTFRSFNGWWKADAKVEVMNAAELNAPATLSATTHPDWKGQRPGKDAPHVTPTDLHVAVTLPNDSSLDGQALSLRATLTVTYPAYITETGIDNKEMKVTHEFPVRLARRADQQAFTAALWGGSAVCLIGVVMGGRLLASGIRTVKGQVSRPELVQLGGKKAARRPAPGDSAVSAPVEVGKPLA
jgi:hypothetical protein